MAIVTYSRAASKDEMAREIDRRGNVIEALEAEVARLREENDILSEMLTERKARAKALEDALRTLVEQRDAHFHTRDAWDTARAALRQEETP